jgi:hypothetical protein
MSTGSLEAAPSTNVNTTTPSNVTNFPPTDVDKDDL